MKLKETYKYIKPTQFYTVHMWMQTELKLTGIKLHTYAVIYGFSQLEGNTYNGSLDFLSEMTGYSKQKLCKCLSEMVEDNLLFKKDRLLNGKKRPMYYCNLTKIPIYN